MKEKGERERKSIRGRQGYGWGHKECQRVWEMNAVRQIDKQRGKWNLFSVASFFKIQHSTLLSNRQISYFTVALSTNSIVDKFSSPVFSLSIPLFHFFSFVSIPLRFYLVLLLTVSTYSPPVSLLRSPLHLMHQCATHGFDAVRLSYLYVTIQEIKIRNIVNKKN